MTLADKEGAGAPSWQHPPMRDAGEAARHAPHPFPGRVPIHVHRIAPPLVCWGLHRLVQTAGAQFVVTCSDRLEEAMPLLHRHPPDVVAIDFDDGYSLEDIVQLYERDRSKVLALTSATEAGFVDAVLAAGARGVLHKREAPAALLRALEAIGQGETFGTRAAGARPYATWSHAAARPHGDEARKIAALTARERQIIVAVTADTAVPAKVIASRLCMSEHTLRNHLTSIYAKLGVPGRLSLYAYASQPQVADMLPGAQVAPAG